MAHPLFSFLRSFFHRISRMNRRHSCLSDYSRIFADIWPLANGWRPLYAPVVFCHVDFADDADFSSWKFFLSHRFHRYTQIFFIMIFLHRISRMNRRHSCLSDYSRNFAELWPLANGWRPIYAPVVFCPTDFTDIHRFFMESLESLCQSQGVSATTGQVASVKIRE